METCRCEPRGWASEHKLGRAPRELTEKAAALCCDLQAQASSLPGAAWLVGEGLSHTAPVTGLVILFYNSPQGTSLGAGAQPTPQPLQGGGWGLQGCARAIQPAAGQLHGQGNLLPAARVSTGFPGGGTKNISRSQSSVSPLPRQGQTKRGADSKATILLMRHHLSHRAGPSSPPPRRAAHRGNTLGQTLSQPRGGTWPSCWTWGEQDGPSPLGPAGQANPELRTPA